MAVVGSRPVDSWKTRCLGSLIESLEGDDSNVEPPSHCQRCFGKSVLGEKLSEGKLVVHSPPIGTLNDRGLVGELLGK
jgi:hypothetical protein